MSNDGRFPNLKTLLRKMANQFTAYIYGIDAAGGNTDVTPAGGVLNSFPSQGVHIYPTTAVRGVAQVTCQSIIEIPGTGLNQRPTKYYTAAAVSTLVTAANA